MFNHFRTNLSLKGCQTSSTAFLSNPKKSQLYGNDTNVNHVKAAFLAFPSIVKENKAIDIRKGSTIYASINI